MLFSANVKSNLVILLLTIFLTACSFKTEPPKILDLDVEVQADRYANQVTAKVRVSNPDRLSQAPTIVFVMPAEVAGFVYGIDQVSEVLTRLPSGVRSSTQTDQGFAGIMLPTSGQPGEYSAALNIDPSFQPSQQTGLLSRIRTTAIVYASDGKETDRRSILLSPEMVLRNAPPEEQGLVPTELVSSEATLVVEVEGEPTAASPHDWQIIDMGEIHHATTTGTVGPYTAHQYRYTKQPSGGYEYVGFALYQISGDLDPYLTVTVNRKTVFENDNSYLADEDPGAARLPDDGFFCTERGAKEPVIFDLLVRSAKPEQQGDYKLSLILLGSRASAEDCVQVFGDGDSMMSTTESEESTSSEVISDWEGFYSYFHFEDKSDEFGYATTGIAGSVAFEPGFIGNALSIPTDATNTMLYLGESVQDRDDTYRDFMYQDGSVNVWVKVRSFDSLTDGMMAIVSGNPAERENRKGCIDAITHWVLSIANVPGCEHGGCPQKSGNEAIHLWVGSYDQNGNYEPDNSISLSVYEGKLEVDTWYMITVTHNSAKNRWSIYVNGILAGSVTGKAPIGSGARTRACPYAIGNRPLADYGYPFSGWIDELSFWDRVLSDEEIRVLMRVYSQATE